MNIIATLISEGNTEGALIELEKLYANTKYENNVIVLINRFNSYKQKQILNTNSNYDLQIELNKVNYDILELLKQSDIKSKEFRRNYYLKIGVPIVLFFVILTMYNIVMNVSKNKCDKYRHQNEEFLSKYEEQIMWTEIDALGLETINIIQGLIVEDVKPIECNITDDEERRIKAIIEKNFTLIDELLNKNKTLLLVGENEKELLNIKKILSLCKISTLLCKQIECSKSDNKLLDELIANFSTLDNENVK